MGEVLASCGEEEVRRTEAEEERWEEGVSMLDRILPKRGLRILLVEADDSTRQIICALLRKCNYRVAAVSDGLKAWEVLKGRSSSIDLILTEVELPSISGFALLTLAMEHDISKNIPVIMMSQNDSVSMVYKCMLRGAADFLVKPIRINELRNLWQHVWRRQSSSGGKHGILKEGVAQQKVEGTSENDDASNHSSANMVCHQQNEECIEKGSDAQSSCTKPDLEAESANMENVQDLSKPKFSKSHIRNVEQKDESCARLGQTLPAQESEPRGLSAPGRKNEIMMSPNKEAESKIHDKDANVATEDGDNNDAFISSSREAIDLIGAFENHTRSCKTSHLASATCKFDSSPQLDLSLRRSCSSSENHITDESQPILSVSNASAFSRYRPLQISHQTPANSPPENYGTSPEKNLSNPLTGNNSESLSPILSTQKSCVSVSCGDSRLAPVASPCPQQRIFPVTVPVRGVKSSNGSVLPPLYYVQTGSSATPSPNSSGWKENSLQMNAFHQSNFEGNNSEQPYNHLYNNANNPSIQNTHKEEYPLDSLEDRELVSAATDQSANSSFCNGTLSHLNNIACGSTCGSNSSVNPAAAIHDENSRRSIQREAALNKFRLKRKERCYEKKVRYESRKKLAEQRPRVKGQFVRQVQSDPSPAQSEHS